MSKLSFKYRFFKLIIKLIGVKKYFNKSESEIISNARKRMKKTKIPVLSHNEINYEIKEFNGAKVAYITHKKPTKKACLFIIGGGMVMHPSKNSIKTALRVALESGRNMVIPYYPLCINHTIDEVYEWMYSLYKSMLNEYNVSDILVTGSSSGATLALGLVSYINISKKDIEVPKRIYASSPGECFKDADLIKKGEILDKKDILLTLSFVKIFGKIMAHGKDMPEYMLYLEKGNYHGVEEVYLSYGSDEVLYAAYDTIKDKLENDGVKVISEIGENLFHCYPFFPIVKETKSGWENMLQYHKTNE
ncbi:MULTISPECIES: alpha/beta hydrolase fold domain-containing protein [unclassified Parvimonas]|uniref:alpha/beta hydrolase fold domain-containing protein n=1 Tax=unclassified Parvimonas TaxID=1151464 RepID=UPI002B4725A2|nr:MULTISPECIES: alpha/beta hydrolase fold domain-containing protein [unclassified Parvimonas]MEB3024841.1 alpha/beta hydrolase fold domain-containing protein [Parvimonas sp. M13]MEB3089011.1 alpha/beta hydrolase fold domain-containing protein [Parvimonas sp. M20]